MRVDGEWLQCLDGGTRPVIRAEVLGGDGVWRETEFLVDTGADRTVLSGEAFQISRFSAIELAGELAESEVWSKQSRLNPNYE
jgi:hypothetical protein